MTDKERTIASLKANGIEPTEIGMTVQWTNQSWTCIAWFDEDGKFVKMERVF